MTYAKIVLALIGLAGALARFFERRGYLAQGDANAILEGMQREARDVEKAIAARRGARRNVERNPDGLRDDDGFKRPD